MIFLIYWSICFVVVFSSYVYKNKVTNSSYELNHIFIMSIYGFMLIPLTALVTLYDYLNKVIK